jgi:hypothetical protein
MEHTDRDRQLLKARSAVWGKSRNAPTRDSVFDGYKYAENKLYVYL